MKEKLFYCAFWMLFMGSFMSGILCVMHQIERNTRQE